MQPKNSTVGSTGSGKERNSDKRQKTEAAERASTDSLGVVDQVRPKLKEMSLPNNTGGVSPTPSTSSSKSDSDAASTRSQSKISLLLQPGEYREFTEPEMASSAYQRKRPCNR